MPANLIFLLFTLPALLASCGSTDPIGEIEIAKKTWEAAGIKYYRADIERICFCPPPARYTMVVEDGVITRIIDSETGEETEQRNGYTTVDELFDWLLQVAPQNPEKLDLEFHPELGYPTLIDYNQSDMIADEELFIRITDLQQG
jgi:hypothetical protein